MKTGYSPRKVFFVAHYLACRLLPGHSSKFSRHDFTLAQLFACLVLREFFGLSYRRTEALLIDSPTWLADVGLTKAPDHNTLWRAFDRLLSMRRCQRLLDLIVALFARDRLLTLRRKPLAIDSTCFEGHHRSTHYDRRCRRMDARQTQNGPGKWGDSVNAARSKRLRQMPKLAIAVDSGSHLILSATVRLGNGSDAPDFAPLLRQAVGRTRVAVVVADAGYDSQANHELARQTLGVRSIIPPGIGRPTRKPPSGRWRRHMANRFKRKADKAPYGQRSQVETVNSMIKRNQSSTLRSRTPERRKKEMMLKVLVHNIVLLSDRIEG